MTSRSEIKRRRRRVAFLLTEGMSVLEIARTLKQHRDIITTDIKTIEDDPNNLDYISPKRALGRLLDRYDGLEREAREHLRRAVDEGKLDAANRWFESVRRLAEDHGRVLQQLGVLNRAIDEVQRDSEEQPTEPTLSPKAQRLLTRIRLAEKLGRSWSGEVTVEDNAEAPTPEPGHRPPKPEGTAR